MALKQKADERGEKKILCNLPGPFVDRFHAYVGAKKKQAGTVHRVTIRGILYDAIAEYMARHPLN